MFRMFPDKFEEPIKLFKPNLQPPWDVLCGSVGSGRLPVTQVGVVLQLCVDLGAVRASKDLLGLLGCHHPTRLLKRLYGQMKGCSMCQPRGWSLPHSLTPSQEAGMRAPLVLVQL